MSVETVADIRILESTSIEERFRRDRDRFARLKQILAEKTDHDCLDQVCGNIPDVDGPYTPLQLVSAEVRGKNNFRIPVNDICLDVVIVDKHHAKLVGNNIYGGDGEIGIGQINPIQVAAFPLDGEVVHLITDGFHRTYEAWHRGRENINAVVMYGLSLREVYNLRILAANWDGTHYARVAEWLKDAFDLTKWSRFGVNLTQAFSLVVQGNPGTRLDLETEELDRLKQWVVGISRACRSTPSTILQQLYVVSKADPALVREVRTGGGGGHGDGAGVFNPGRLGAIVKHAPDDHQVQRQVYELVIEKDLKVPETAGVTQAMSAFGKDPAIVEIIKESPRLASLVVEYVSDKNLARQILQVSFNSGLTLEEAEMLCAVVLEARGDDDIVKAILENPVSYIEVRGLEAKAISEAKKQKRTYVSHDHSDAGYITVRSSKDYEEELDFLRNALKVAQRTSGIASQEDWWRNHPDLSMAERRILELMIDGGLSVKETAKTLSGEFQRGITENQIIKMVRSACMRYLLSQQEDIENWLDKNIFGSLTKKEDVESE